MNEISQLMGLLGAIEGTSRRIASTVSIAVLDFGDETDPQVIEVLVVQAIREVGPRVRSLPTHIALADSAVSEYPMGSLFSRMDGMGTHLRHEHSLLADFLGLLWEAEMTLLQMMEQDNQIGGHLDDESSFEQWPDRFSQNNDPLTSAVRHFGTEALIQLLQVEDPMGQIATDFGRDVLGELLDGMSLERRFDVMHRAREASALHA